MHAALALIISVVLVLSPLASFAQDGGATLDGVGRTLGASTLRSIQSTGSGGVYAVGQSAAPGLPCSQLDDLLPRHDRLVPLAGLNRTIGKTP